MPFQYLQQICQLYNYENKFVSEGPSFCFDHKLEGMVQRTPAAMFFEKWSSSQPTTSGVKKPKFSSNRDKDILSQLTVPNCKKMTATYAAPTIENRPFLETATLHIDDGQTILVLRCKYCAPLCDRQCNLKNMKLCYGFATEEAYKETRKSVLGEHARGDTPSTNHSVQNKVSSCCRSISSLWTWKNSWIWKIVDMFVFFSVSTACVERSFSKEKLMHISSTSPDVSGFDPEPILIFWK